MGDDYDYQRDKDDEMLADYYDDLVTEERQAYCEHSNSYVQGIRILIAEDSEVMKRPLLRQHDKQYYEIEIEELEVNYYCSDCGKDIWESTDISDYVEGLDCDEILSQD